MSTPEKTETDTKPLRLLIPINANEDSRWGIQYAMRRYLEGAQIEVFLLNIGEPITQWEVLRFRTQQEIDQFQLERAQAFIDEASLLLAQDDIPCRGLFKQGEVIFTILDTAEELDCDEIVMPTPNTWLSGLFSRDVVNAVLHQQRNIPVVVVNSEGKLGKPNSELH